MSCDLTMRWLRLLCKAAVWGGAGSCGSGLFNAARVGNPHPCGVGAGIFILYRVEGCIFVLV